MAKKFTNFNNDLTRRIMMYSCANNPSIAFTLLLKHRYDYEHTTFISLFSILNDLCPLRYSHFKKLHPQYRSYISSIYEEFIAL